MRVRPALLLILLLFSPVFAKEIYQQAGPIRITVDGQRWAEHLLRSMTVEQKAGQLLMLRAPTEFYNVANPQLAAMRETIRRYGVGGVLLTVPADGAAVYKSQPYEAAMLTNTLQRDAEQPLLIAADFERGLSNRFYGATVFPSAMAFGAAQDPLFVSEFARITGIEARAIGVQWTFFPIADVNSEPNNPIINIRAFGEDPKQVGELTAAYIHSSAATGLLTTAKHFPGHGDTSIDTHLNVAQVHGSKERLEAVELRPFKDAIQAGVDAVMIAHVTVPALEPDPARVASLSRRVVTNTLKDELGFQGLVVTDAMDMGAITRQYSSGRAAVEAIKAGNDIIVIPADVAGAHAGLVSAVRTGEISMARLDDSVRKVLYAKASLGLNRTRLVDLNAISSVIGRPENQALAQTVADSAVTLVRENGGLLPLKKEGTSAKAAAYVKVEGSGTSLLNVVFTDNLRTDQDRIFEREMRKRVPDEATIYIEPKTADAMDDATLRAVERAEKVVIAVYLFPSAGAVGQQSAPGGEVTLRSTAEIAGPAAKLLHQILAKAKDKTVVIAMGSPYLIAGFPEIQNYVCTFSPVTISELAAVKAIFGEISIRGRLPVTLPGIAERGFGLERPAQASRWRRGPQKTNSATTGF